MPSIVRHESEAMFESGGGDKKISRRRRLRLVKQDRTNYRKSSRDLAI